MAGRLKRREICVDFKTRRGYFTGMKNITISIDDEVYRAASEEAARLRKSLSELVQEFLTRLRAEREQNGSSAQAAPELPAAMESDENGEQRKSRESLAQFFAELNTRPLTDGPSVGPLNREELYERGKRLEPELPVATDVEEEEFRKRREDLTEFFAALKAKHEAGQSEDKVKQAERLERLQTLVELLLERDRDKKGSLAVGTRKEWYSGFDSASLESQLTAGESEEAKKKRQEDFIRFLDELDARPLKDGPSVGPLNREEFYQRGISGY